MTAERRRLVRPGSPADLNSLIALDRATEFAPHWPLSVYTEIVRYVPGSTRFLTVATEEDGYLVGFAAVVAASNGSAEIESVVVAAGARRQGTGRALCTELLRWCREHSISRVELEVRASGLIAASLYCGLGFVEFARRPRYYREPEEDAIVMWLSIE